MNEVTLQQDKNNSSPFALTNLSQFTLVSSDEFSRPKSINKEQIEFYSPVIAAKKFQ